MFLAFCGYRLTFRSFRLPLFARSFHLTGTEFLFLGLLLGPQFLNLVDAETHKGLDPLIALALGWVGLVVGFQFEISKLKRFPFEYLLAAQFEGLFTLVVVFGTAYVTLPSLFEMSKPMVLVAALVLSAAAACSAQTGLGLMAPVSVTRKEKDLRLLRCISSLDGLSALVFIGLAFALRPSPLLETSWIWALVRGMAVGVGAGLCLLLLFTLLLHRRLSESELTLVVIGMAILATGTASVLNLSPLLTCAFIGMCLVNVSKQKERIYNILISVEKPVYLLMLVFLGLEWRIDAPVIFIGAFLYWSVRLMAKVSAGFLVVQSIPALRTHPRYLGFGLLDQGGLPLAVLMDFSRSFPGDVTGRVLGVALVAVILNDLASPYFLGRFLKEKGN